MNSAFWGKFGLLLFIFGTIGWFTDFSALKLGWIYLPLIGIGTILYLMPEEYYGKRKGEK